MLSVTPEISNRSTTNRPPSKRPRDTQSSYESLSNMSQSQETTSTSDWHLHFEIPAMGSFSRSVQEAIKTGVITAKARKEIIQVFRTYITKYTVYPSSEQYVTVCQQLVTKYPKLKDEKGSSTFVSTIKVVVWVVIMY